MLPAVEVRLRLSRLFFPLAVHVASLPLACIMQTNDSAILARYRGLERRIIVRSIRLAGSREKCCRVGPTVVGGELVRGWFGADGGEWRAQSTWRAGGISNLVVGS